MVKKIFEKEVLYQDGTTAYNIVASLVDIKGNKVGFLKYQTLNRDLEEGDTMTPHEFERHWKQYFVKYDDNTNNIKEYIKENNMIRVK